MGKLFCLMGKSSSGKDTISKRLLEDPRLPLRKVVPGTTRPKRENETDGVEYHFYTEEELRALEETGRIIELRSYDTACGIWKYFTADDGHIDLERENYLMIGTLDSYLRLREYYGEGRVFPIYLWAEDGERLERALRREREQPQPKYAEMCRRYLADEQDFSPERLSAARIERQFQNQDLDVALEEITAYIKSIL